MTDPVILSFETSGPHCAAALRWGPSGKATRFEEMAKGQAERLMVLLEDLLEEEGFDWPDLDALAVGVGPGNFTGIRIAVSAARGLALGLGIPAISVTNFEIMRGANSVSSHSPQFVTLPAPRGAAYGQGFQGGVAMGRAQLFGIGDADLTNLQIPGDADILGHQGSDIAHLLQAAHGHPQRAGIDAVLRNIPETLSAIATAKWHAGLASDSRPAPLYIKPPDAAPPRDTAPAVVP